MSEIFGSDAFSQKKWHNVLATFEQLYSKL